MALKYLISYITEDSKNLGSNVFWHAGIMLSVFDESSGRMEVKGSWGLHSDPIQLDTSMLSKIKSKLGLKFRLTGGSGTLKEESIRDLDRGVGLYGRHIEITQEQAEQFQNNIRLKLMMQADAIEESKAQLKSQLLAAGVSLQAVEALLTNEAIFNTELEHIESCLGSVNSEADNTDTKPANPSSRQQAKNMSRLRPFEFTPGHITQSNVCKVEVIRMLKEIGIANAILQELSGNALTYAIPRFSGPQTPIHAHSEGAAFVHKRTHGQLSRYRVWGATAKEMKQFGGANPRAAKSRVFWTLPPRCFDPLNNQDSIPTIGKAAYVTLLAPYTRLLKLRKIIENSVEAAKTPTAQSCAIDKIESVIKRFSYFNRLTNESYVEDLVDRVNILISTIHAETALTSSTAASTPNNLQLTPEEISKIQAIDTLDEQDQSNCIFSCMGR